MFDLERKCMDSFLCKFQQGDPSECWLWEGASHSKKGYGFFWDNISKEHTLAHRFSYKLFVGSIPKGMCVCHRCDNPRCVNPRHLFLGTHADNMVDMVSKGRSTRGERAPEVKLTVEQVMEIKRTIQGGEWNPRELATRYGVSRTLFYAIRRGRAWSWVEI